MQLQKQQYCKLGLTTLFIFSGTIVNQSALAQLTPDNTLGTENSIINQIDSLKTRIEGGATRGSNLFHSFQEFNIDTGKSVYFANPTGIENILTRVTGGNVSNILGTLGIEGTANLFLINPNGIYFGTGASLDIRGSFTATTADSIKLGENGLFSATNPQSSNLLNVQPGALFTNALRNYQAEIKNEGNLQVGDGKTLTLLGAKVNISGNLTTRGGTIQVLGKDINLVDNALINVSSPTNAGNIFIGGDFQGKGQIPNADITYIGEGVKIKADSLNNGNGGNVVVWANGLTGFHGDITAKGGEFSGNGGFVEVSGKDNLIFRGNINTSALNGMIGTLLIDPKDIIIADGAGTTKYDFNDTQTIYEETLEGLSGSNNLILEATNDITLNKLTDNSLTLASGSGKITFTADSDKDGIGNFKMETGNTIKTYGREISITGANLTLGNIDTINNDINNFLYKNFGILKLNAGNITLTATKGNISTQSLNSSSFSETSQTLGSVTAGNGGTMTLTATKGNISTQNLNSSSYSTSGTPGNGGGIILNAGGNISTQNLGSYTSSGIYTAGNGGVITLTAGGDISTQSLNSSSSSLSGTPGNGGDMTLKAGGNISTQNLVSSSSSLNGTAGNGGTMTLTATKGNISTQSLNSSSSSTFETAGNGGGMTLTAGGNIKTQNLDSNTLSYFGGVVGNGGDMTLNAGGDISTQNLNSSSFLFTGTAGNGGGMNLKAGGNIKTQKLDSYTLSYYGTAARNGGRMNLNAGGDISTTSLNSFSYSGSGTAGNGGGMNLKAGGDIKGMKDVNNVFSSFSVSQKGISGQGGNVTLAAKNKITDLDILTLSSSKKSGDVEVNGSGDLSLTNTAIITSKQLTIPLLIYGPITLNVGGVGQSGNVDISSTGNLSFNNSRIESDTKGDNPAGKVKITSPGTVTFNNSKIVSNTSSIGKAGDILINANDLTLTDDSEISASTTAKGKAGDITFNTPTLTVANGAKIFAETKGKGDGGTIIINAPNKVNLGIGVQDFAPILSVETSGAGKAGNIVVNTPSLTVSDTARITATATATATNPEGGGSITLNASKMNLAGVVGVFAETQGESPAGTLKLNPYQNQPDLDITLFPGSIISASTTRTGKGGDLQVSAPETINISGQGKLAVETSGNGNAGNIKFTTSKLNLQDGVEISASTSGNGKGGNIDIEANNFKAESGGKLTTKTSAVGQAGTIILRIKNNLNLTGEGTGIFANTEIGSTGAGGSIDIDPITMLIENGANVRVNSQGTGIAGNIKIEAGDLTLKNQGVISAETVGGEGGNIDLNVTGNLWLRNNSLISAEAGNAGNGGNININSGQFILAVLSENSDIVANAYQGTGGKITGKAEGIFGFRQLAKERTSESDFIASSKLGLDGIVSIETNELNIPQLSTSLLDAESLKKDVCAIKDDKIAGGSSFTITGKGGLPADTHELISNSPAFVEWENNSPSVTQVSNSPVKVTQKGTNHRQEIQQAQGWIIGEDGKVILTADSQKVTLQTDKNNLPDCK